MKVKLYDKVLLKNGNTAFIVEICEEDKFFIADIKTDSGTSTEDLKIEEIERVL